MPGNETVSGSASSTLARVDRVRRVNVRNGLHGGFRWQPRCAAATLGEEVAVTTLGAPSAKRDAQERDDPSSAQHLDQPLQRVAGNVGRRWAPALQHALFSLEEIGFRY